MSLDISTGRAIRTPDALGALVTAIVLTDASTTQETHWLEWKGPLSLDKREGQFLIAKAILGFANRDPRHAATVCEGVAYMVVGAQPGSALGVDPIDSAQLGQGVRKYANGPQWSAHYVDHDGASVLVVLVEPPRAGDPIHTLARQYDKFDEGTIFHRGTGQTEPAGSREVAMLSQRLVQGVEEPELDLELKLSSTPLIRHSLDDETIDEWLDEREEHLNKQRKPEKPPPRPPPERPPGSLAWTNVDGAYGIPTDLLGLWAKPEETKEFNRRVATYLKEFRERLPQNIIRNLIQSNGNKVVFHTTNETSDPVRDVQLLVTLPRRGIIAFAGAPETQRLPPRPHWPTPVDSIFRGRPSSAYGEEFEPADILSRWDGSVDYRPDTIEITFEVGDLRPGQRYETPAITLYATPDAPERLPVEVTARAMNRRRNNTETFELPILSETWSVGNWYRATPRDES